ncbi:MAG: hypothetical protein ACON4U_09805 [Myxococcota bacterium]
MILLMSLGALAADHWDLLRAMQEKQAVLSQPILLGTTNAETKSAVEIIQRIDPNLRIRSQALPVIGDFDAEINRALAQNQLSCAIVLRLENNNWSFTEHGDCTSPDPTLSLNESESGWEVVRTDRRVSAMEWAVLTKDTDLHDLLLEEQKSQLTKQRGLLIGSGIVAVSSIAPLQGIQPGGGSATEDRLWTSAFLLSTAWMLYKASKYPPLKTADNQQDLSNYISKPYAQTTINGLFTTQGPENNTESQSQSEIEVDVPSSSEKLAPSKPSSDDTLKTDNPNEDDSDSTKGVEDSTKGVEQEPNSNSQTVEPSSTEIPSQKESNP